MKIQIRVANARHALVDVAKVRAGQRVLIHAAGGGVGHLAVQIAKAHGAYVIGTASRAKHDFVRGLGADELIDYRVTDFVAAVKDVDVAFDLVGRDYGARSIEVLRQGGLLVTIDRTNASVAALLRPLRSATPVSPSSQITSGSTRWPRWWQTESCESMWTRCFRSRRRPAPMRCSPEAAQPEKSS